MNKYAVMARPSGADVGEEIEICRVGSNPETIVAALLEKTKVVRDDNKKKKVVQVYEHVYFKEVP